jgi:hypothetical protein
MIFIVGGFQAKFWLQTKLGIFPWFGKRRDYEDGEGEGMKEYEGGEGGEEGGFESTSEEVGGEEIEISLH